MKCIILLKSEHFNVPLYLDLAVEFNLLKSTHGTALEETPLLQPSPRNMGREPGRRGMISFCDKYGSVLNWSIQILLLGSPKSNRFAHCRHHQNLGSALLWEFQHRDTPYRSYSSNRHGPLLSHRRGRPALSQWLNAILSYRTPMFC